MAIEVKTETQGQETSKNIISSRNIATSGTDISQVIGYFGCVITESVRTRSRDGFGRADQGQRVKTQGDCANSSPMRRHFLKEKGLVTESVFLLLVKGE